MHGSTTLKLSSKFPGISSSSALTGIGLYMVKLTLSMLPSGKVIESSGGLLVHVNMGRLPPPNATPKKLSNPWANVRHRSCVPLVHGSCLLCYLIIWVDGNLENSISKFELKSHFTQWHREKNDTRVHLLKRYQMSFKFQSNNLYLGGSIIAQWICLRLLSCWHGFESHAQPFIVKLVPYFSSKKKVEIQREQKFKNYIHLWSSLYLGTKMCFKWNILTVEFSLQSL